MNYGNIKFYDIANGEGVRVSLFVSGCTNKCIGCFNPEAQDFEYGKLYTPSVSEQILEQISKDYIAGLSILGGDPMCQGDAGLCQLIHLINAVHDMGKTVWLWTGFKWEDLVNSPLDFHGRLIYTLLTSCDVVVDGAFIEAKKDLTLKWRGSSNQRVIDVKETLVSDKIILYEE